MEESYNGRDKQTNETHLLEGNGVWYPTLNSTLYRSKIDNNSWSPDEYANGWEIYVP